MSAPIASCQVEIRVRYAETDQMGVVYHSNFFIWFEVGRVELLRQLGFTYKEMESVDDTHLPVVEVRCRYKAPAQYDDLLVVRTHMKNVRDSLIPVIVESPNVLDHLIATEHVPAMLGERAQRGNCKSGGTHEDDTGGHARIVAQRAPQIHLGRGEAFALNSMAYWLCRCANRRALAPSGLDF